MRAQRLAPTGYNYPPEIVSAGRSPVNIERIREFVTVASTLSFTTAADMLCVELPTLSRHIRNLETSLGIQLFDRTTRSVALTKQGEVLLPKASRLCRDYDDLLNSIKPHASTITVVSNAWNIPVATEGFYHTWMLFHDRHPETQCTTVDDRIGDNGFTMLLNGEADLSMTVTPLDAERMGLTADTIEFARVYAYLSRKNALAKKPRISLHDLEGLTYRPTLPHPASANTLRAIEILKNAGVTFTLGHPLDSQWLLAPNDFSLVYGGSPSASFEILNTQIEIEEEVLMPLGAVHRGGALINEFVAFMKKVSQLH